MKEEQDRLIDQIADILDTARPAIAVSVLAGLIAAWLADISPSKREQALATLTRFIGRMAREIAAENNANHLH